MDPALLELIAAGAWDDEVAVIVRLRPGLAPPPALRIVARFGDVATGRAARGLLAAIHEHAAVASLKAPRVYAGETDLPFADRPPVLEPGPSEADPSPIDSDRRRPPSLGETGRGVVVAVIDWGLDFAHEDFRRADGGTRLIALWDQRTPGSPAPYGYGQIHPRSRIDAALRTSDPFAALGYRPSQTSHGTHVMGIAAGNGRAGGPEGIAPEAELVFVHLGPGLGDLGNSIDLLEAVDFVVRAAADRPVALNMSIGRHAGPHDGTLLIERAIDWLIVNRPGTVVVQSTGNYYARATHMQGRLREAEVARLPFTLPRSDAQPVTLELWYQGADRFTARARSPDGDSVVAPPGSSAPLTARDGREIGRLYNRLGDPNNGDNLIALVLRPPVATGSWLLEAAGLDVVDGRWHCWIERNATCPQCQAVFARADASPATTTGSICNAMRTIAVGAFDGHDPERPLARFSSVGPTRDGRRKPLVAAPGVRVLSVRSRLSAAEPPGYARMSGTSMAAPHVTGTAALMLQAAGRQPIAAIRKALFATLGAPGPTPAGEEERWGYGILDIEAAVAAARRLGARARSGARHRERTPTAAAASTQEVCIMDEYDDEAGAAGRPMPMAGPPVVEEELRWTKGRRVSLMTPEQRVLSQFSDDELRDMLDLPPAPPVAVASRESETGAPAAEPAAAAPPPPHGEPDPWSDPSADAPAGGPAATGQAPPAEPPAPEPVPGAEPAAPLPPLPADPATLVKVAIDPQMPSTQIIGWPGTRLIAPLVAGDIILRGTRKRRARIVRRAGVKKAGQVARRSGRPAEAGLYAEIVGEGGAKRIAGPDGLLLPDVTIIRSVLGLEAGESDPPLVPRPAIRQGSRGPAVSEAQTRLNAVHASRTAAGQRGIDRCPLVVDGAFGANTRAAVVAFQRTAFPDRPGEWDGLVGPRTWAALLAASEGGEEEARLPTRCPGLPREQQLDRFDFNSSEVLPRHQPQIVGIARCILESRRTAAPIRRLRLVGHTDPVGSDSANVSLGMRRSEAVRREILAAIARISGRPAPSDLVIAVESRGEREQLGDPATSRRVQVLSDFAFIPASPPPAAAATVEFVLDDDGDHHVDDASPVATALMFGLWDRAFDGSGALRNDAAEDRNFVGSDVRRFYIRVRDPAASGTTVTARWKTLNARRGNEDAPASQAVTLTETAAGSKIFVSKALMLVTDNTDARQPTHSGLTSGPDAGLRRRGQSNHRLRRAVLDGFVSASYRPARGRAASIELPVFQRTPSDARRRLTVRVVRYTGHASLGDIDGHFAFAARRWAQTGLKIDRGAVDTRPIPAGAADADGDYVGSGSAAGRAAETAALDDLLPGTPDRTVTVIFCRKKGANAYATLNHRAAVALGERYFIFIRASLPPEGDTLGHELHHVLNNRGDADNALGDLTFRAFFSFNTHPSSAYGLPLPNVLVRRRCHTLHSADPNSDPGNDNVINWMKRRRTRRFNPGNTLPGALDAPDPTTGNILTGAF